ncbi:MAG: hypothetical protein NC187_09025 [Candidatus Amulumruptor caecigallinarius]|nr:hypothetical protein [Candidatus Amulumruptor caecigallinarius]MCM1397610.1 hypothetical protein [Candidatus Amulumruptor caecigallinarius]MCM1454607.1 hypothetical protein [bacterium]
MAAVAILTSCNKTDNSLLDTIPADATLVARFDGDKLLKSAGCKISSDGVLETPEALRHSIDGTIGLQQASQLAAVAHAIDMKNVVMYATTGDFITTFMITDTQEFDKAMEATGAKKESAGDFDAYVGRMVTLVKGHQGWFAEGPLNAVAGEVDAMLSKASDRPFSAMHGLTQYLGSANALGIIINPIAFGIQAEDTWLAGNLTLENANALLAMQLMQADGKIIPVTMLKAINTDFLRYVPGDFNFAAAMGVAKPEDVARVAQVIGHMLTFRERGIIESLTPFLQRVTGTVSVAARLDDTAADDDFSRPDLMIMAAMSQEDVNASVQQLLAMASGMGASVSDAGAGMHLISAPGMKVYIGSVDGQLALSTVPMENTRNNSLNDSFLSRNAALRFDMPAGYKGIFNRPATITANVQEQQMQVEMKFDGTSTPFLQTYMEAAVNR